jgi:hypothetical protein
MAVNIVLAVVKIAAGIVGNSYALIGSNRISANSPDIVAWPKGNFSSR